jgi:hypothetical protein
MVTSASSPQVAEAVDAQEAFEIGLEAFYYFYPLVTMDVTRRVTTNVEPGQKSGFGPMNTMNHMRAFPDAEFRAVVRANVDTLYSSAWLDLTREPIIVSAPDTGGRYYLLPMLDMWTDVFAVPGKRTSGTQAGHFGLVPPGWRGQLPDSIARIQAPTPYVWIIGRTQTNGPADYEAVHKVQDGYSLTPLSEWGQAPRPVEFKLDPTVDMQTDPLQQVNSLSAAAYFGYAAELLEFHPPHITDWSILARMRRIDLDAGQSFDFERLEPIVQRALDGVPATALQAMRAKEQTLARVVNGWSMNTDTMGVYGNFYLKRAVVAMIGLGANQPEDAIYPMNVADSDGAPLQGENRYVLHFDKRELPPIEAFWSLTMYDAEGFQAANPINRFALGDRDALRYKPDGSLDLYIQHDTPGAELESNWLPAPLGPLGMTMRLYAPKAAALDGTWNPPGVQRS